MKHIFKNEKIHQSAFIDVQEMPFDEKSRQYCKANLCGEYGRTWACPPATGCSEECRRNALTYDKAFVFTYKDYVEDVYNLSQVDDLRNKTMSILFEICEKLKNNGIRYLALGCSGCKECAECTYPDNPCRFPEKAVPPAEAYCIDVSKLAEKTGLIYFAGENVVTFFCIILFEELK